MRRAVLFAILGGLAVAAAPLSAHFFWLPPGPEEALQVTRSEVSLPWRVVEQDPIGLSPHVAAPSVEFVRTYDSSRQVVVKFYVTSYGADRRGVKVASATSMLFDNPWGPTAEGHTTLTAGRQSFQARETTVRSQTSSLVVLDWYWVDGTFTGNEYLAKLLLARARLFSSRQEAVAMAVVTARQPGIDAGTVLNDFLEHLSLALPDGRSATIKFKARP